MILTTHQKPDGFSSLDPAFLEMIPVALCFCDADGVIRAYNAAAAELWGREPHVGAEGDLFCGALEIFDARGRVMPRSSTPGAVALATGLPQHDWRATLGRPDGTRIAVAIDVDPIRDPDGDLLGTVSVYRDITHARSVESYRAAQLGLTQVLASCATIAEAAPRLLSATCETLRWDVGALWLPHPNGLFLRCAQLVHREGFSSAEFVGLTRKMTFALGAGLPGRIWASGEPRWVREVHSDADFPRARAAMRDQLCSGFGYPIRAGQRVLGVLEFFSTEKRERDESLLSIMGSFGSQIGQFMERERAERAASEGEETFRRIVETAGEGLWMIDADARITLVNHRMAEMLGHSRESMLGQSPWSFMFEEDVAATRALFERRRLGISEQVDLRFRHHDGHEVWTILSARPITTETGEFRGALDMFTDVTERKRAESSLRLLIEAGDALAESLDYRVTLQNVARLAVPTLADWCVVDMIEDDHLKRVAIHHPDPAFIARAREFEQRFPADRHSPAIHHVLETGASRLVPEITDAMLVANAANDEHLAALRRFGATSCLLVPLEAHDQRFGVLTLITSDTPRRLGKRDLRIAEDLAWRSAVAIDNARLYERLVEGDRRKDEFLATLAHELRNPLAPMRNALALLRSQGDEAPVRDNARTILERQLAQVVRLIDDLLDISRITRDKLVLRREPVTLASVIRDSIDTVRPTIDAAGHTLEVDLPDDPIPLDADRARLTQVFSNLLDNAAKYTEPGGRIGVFAQRKDGEVIVRVRDNGIGIPPEKLSRIFDLFVQVDASLERTHGGLGIGLTLAQRLVAMHGGSIEVSSEGPGKGTEFRVRLPVAAGATPPVRASKEPSEGKRPPLNRRILIADDVADSAESMALVLLMLGAEVRTARDGEQALEIAAQFRPQAALIDIGMPRLNGYQVAQRLRAEPWGKDMLLIALTGWGQEADRRASREAGFDHHVVKPVDIDALREILESEHVAAD